MPLTADDREIRAAILALRPSEDPDHGPGCAGMDEWLQRRGFPGPAAAATACGGRISVVVATAGNLDEAEVDRLAESWRNALAWIAS
jgi:L-aminopeptidase/D-esterase-like protein